jgi:hypothetical protein
MSTLGFNPLHYIKKSPPKKATNRSLLIGAVNAVNTIRFGKHPGNNEPNDVTVVINGKRRTQRLLGGKSSKKRRSSKRKSRKSRK